MVRSGVFVLFLSCSLLLVTVGQVHAQPDVTVTTDKSTYQPGDKVTISVSISPPLSTSFPCFYVGVTPIQYQIFPVYYLGYTCTSPAGGTFTWIVPSNATLGHYDVEVAIGAPTGWENYSGFTVTSQAAP